MAKFKPILERILFIDREIRARKYPNCTSLARHHEVSPRTISRDIEYMKDMLDAPIEFDSKHNGYYYTVENFFLPSMIITESDLFAVCIAEKALEQYRDTPVYGRLQSVFDKIRDLLPETVRVNTSWVDTDLTFKPESATRIKPEVWETISTALRLRHEVRLTHHSPGHEDKDRTVQPYHLVNYRGEWYLIAHCLLKKEVRTFAVSRISSARDTEKEFAVTGDFNFEEYLGSHFGIMRDTEEYTVKVRFAPELAPYARERVWNRDQEIIDGPDGSAVLSFRTRSLIELKRWVLSWGAGVQVMEPVALADMVRDELKSMLKMHGE
jgi:predicted DNA-binding transcriptional regulator YafY